ncbi:MAG: hypothetical protein V2A79_01320 [Planctomycetota bacterium]
MKHEPCRIECLRALPFSILHSPFSICVLVAQARPVDVGGATQEALQHSARLYAALFYGVLVLLILAFAWWALWRASRRYKERLRHKPAGPTRVPDVWSMHKPPDEDLDHER